MINGIVVGIVVDNVDPDRMNRVKVEYPVDNSDRPQSSWCRMMMPMAGQTRGMVMLPDIGTEVVLAFAYRSMSPYVIGAVYNKGEDLPEPYHNDDEENNLRVYWSRNDHMVIFDDTPGAEKVQFGAKAGSRLDVTSAPVYDDLDAAEETITEFVEKDLVWETVEKISLKCMDFELKAANSIKMQSGVETRKKAGANLTIKSGGTQMYHAAVTKINSSEPPPDPKPAEPLPEHEHPPR